MTVAPKEPGRREVCQKIGQAANRGQVGSHIRPDVLRDEHALLDWRQLLVLLEPPSVYVRLLLDIVLLHDFHLGKLMLVDQGLGEHLVRDQRQGAVFAPMKHLKLVILGVMMVLLMKLVLAKRDSTGVLGVLTLIKTDLKRALTIHATRVDIGDRLKALNRVQTLLIADPDSTR